MSRRIARPYATALFQVLERTDPTALRAAQHQLELVAAVFAAERRLLRVFEVPGVAPGRKREVLDAIGRELELRLEVRRLLAALAQHYRLRSLPDVAVAMRELIDRREGLVRGSVELPAPPETRQLDELKAALASMVGSRIELESKVTPELLAGFVVRLGSRVYDGSLKAQLARFAAGLERG